MAAQQSFTVCYFCSYQVNDLLYFFPTSENGELKFVWATEETGFRHLYLITAQMSGFSNGVEETLERMESEELYSSLLSSTLQFVRSKIMFHIHLITSSISRHLACSFLCHILGKIMICRMPSSGMLHRVALVGTTIVEEHIAYVIRATRISK
jgi:hypothetical protein